jgi:hypothetical protein
MKENEGANATTEASSVAWVGELLESHPTRARGVAEKRATHTWTSSPPPVRPQALRGALRRRGQPGRGPARRARRRPARGPATGRSGSRLVAPIARSNWSAVSHPRRTTHRSRSRATWAGGRQSRRNQSSPTRVRSRRGTGHSSGDMESSRRAQGYDLRFDPSRDRHPAGRRAHPHNVQETADPGQGPDGKADKKCAPASRWERMRRRTRRRSAVPKE